MSVRLHPVVQWTNDPMEEWDYVEDVKSWYVYDVDEEKYYDIDTNQVTPHKRVPGICIAFNIDSTEVAMTIPWRDLVFAMNDVIMQDERYKEKWNGN